MNTVTNNNILAHISLEQYIFFAHQRLVFNSGFFTVRSAAPQTALWEGPGPIFEPWMGSSEAWTLTIRPQTSLKNNGTMAYME